LHTWALRPNVLPNGRGLFAHGGADVLYIDAESGRETKINEEPVKPVAVILGVSGTTAFHNLPGGRVRQWDAATGRRRQAFDPPRTADGKPAGIELMSMSPDGKRVAMLSSGMQMVGQTGWYNGAHISLYDAATGALIQRWQTAEARF